MSVTPPDTYVMIIGTMACGGKTGLACHGRTTLRATRGNTRPVADLLCERAEVVLYDTGSAHLLTRVSAVGPTTGPLTRRKIAPPRGSAVS
jgi:hypothetical protein